MKAKNRVITRRDFIRTGSCMVMGGIMGLLSLGRGAAKGTDKSRVVLIRDERVVEGYGSLRHSNLKKMLDQAIITLLEAGDSTTAWQQLVNPTDVVGIKSNVWRPLPTPSSLEQSISKRLREAGVREQNIAVDDRGVVQNPVFKQSTALINVRPMRTHHWSGLGTLIKNYIMFAAHPWQYHGKSCERLGAIWQKPNVKGKTRLNILVMLTPLFHGIGPHHFSRRYLWPYGGLIVSTDPVAADVTGARIIQAKRFKYFGKDRPVSPPPRHIEAADTKFGLGNSHPERIELIKLGWKEDILI